MKLHHLFDKESDFAPLDIETDIPLFRSPEHRRRKLHMEEKGYRRGRFIRKLKAVLFHIKLARGNREKRIGSDSMRRLNSSFSFRFRKQNYDNKESKLDLPRLSTSTRSISPSILSSSSSSNSSSSSRLSFQLSEPRTSVSSTANHQNRKPQKQRSLKEQGRSVEKQSSVKETSQRSGGASIMIGFVLILMSLGVTVLLGKVWAIAFNAMWLACVPQKWSMRLTSDDGDNMVVESVKEVRRRVIMEGLLDRRHHHKQQQK